MSIWWCCVGVLCYVNMILYCVWCDLVCCCAHPVWLCPDGFMPDFIVIDVIYYFLIAYNVWLYIYVFRRILLFLYVVECWFSLVFIDFMPFMVLWSYFLFMQNFTMIHSRMYWRTKNTPYGYILSKLYIISIQFKSIKHLFKLSIQLKICILQLRLSRPWSAVQNPDKILVLSQKFLSDVLPRVFCPCQKSQIITKLDFFTLPTKMQKLVLFNNSKAFQELHSLLF